MAIKQLESQLWDVANNLRANSALSLNEFSEPVLGLIFLKFADVRFTEAKKESLGYIQESPDS